MVEGLLKGDAARARRLATYMENGGVLSCRLDRKPSVTTPPAWAQQRQHSAVAAS